MATTEMIVPQETKKQVLEVQKQANAFVVDSPTDAEAGANLLHLVKNAEDALKERKEEITRPLMKSLSSVRDLFKPYELGLAEAKKTLKAKLLSYQIEQEAKVEAQKEKVLKRVEKGTMRVDTAATKLGEIGEVTSVKGTQTRTLTKVRVVDETVIPREYLVPDMGKIVEDILHKGAEIPGVEKYEEKILAVR